MGRNYKPRPTGPGKQRTGRPSNAERFQGAFPPDVRPDPSSFTVDGRADVVAWSPERRTKFTELSRLAEGFGLVVNEFSPHLRKPRRAWARKRTDLDAAEIAVERGGTGGVRFDAWVVSSFLHGAPADNELLLAAARRRAQVAVSRMTADGRLVKGYDREGNLLLYVPEHAPKEAPDASS